MNKTIKELESLTKRIRFKSLPFDEKQMSDRLSDRVKRPVIILIPVKKTLHGNICLLLLPSPSYWLPAFC